MTIAPIDVAAVPASAGPRRGLVRDLVRRHPTALAGATLLILMVLMAVFAPYLGTVDPQALSPVRRLRPPSALYWFGTDMLGRDVYSRVVYGARVSLTVGIFVALFSSAVGIAIALMALTRASIGNVILAITVAEVPRVTRLARSVVLSLREQPFVEAAIA